MPDSHLPVGNSTIMVVDDDPEQMQDMQKRKEVKSMGSTGLVCTLSGIYRSSDCDYETAVSKREKFPTCPTHGYTVTWFKISGSPFPPSAPRLGTARRAVQERGY